MMTMCSGEFIYVVHYWVRFLVVAIVPCSYVAFPACVLGKRGQCGAPQPRSEYTWDNPVAIRWPRGNGRLYERL